MIKNDHEYAIIKAETDQLEAELRKDRTQSDDDIHVSETILLSDSVEERYSEMREYRTRALSKRTIEKGKPSSVVEWIRRNGPTIAIPILIDLATGLAIVGVAIGLATSTGGRIFVGVVTAACLGTATRTVMVSLFRVFMQRHVNESRLPVPQVQLPPLVLPPPPPKYPNPLRLLCIVCGSFYEIPTDKAPGEFAGRIGPWTPRHMILRMCEPCWTVSEARMPEEIFPIPEGTFDGPFPCPAHDHNEDGSCSNQCTKPSTHFVRNDYRSLIACCEEHAIGRDKDDDVHSLSGKVTSKEI